MTPSAVFFPVTWKELIQLAKQCLLNLQLSKEGKVKGIHCKCMLTLNHWPDKGITLQWQQSYYPVCLLSGYLITFILCHFFVYFDLVFHIKKSKQFRQYFWQKHYFGLHELMAQQETSHWPFQLKYMITVYMQY